MNTIASSFSQVSSQVSTVLFFHKFCLLPQVSFLLSSFSCPLLLSEFCCVVLRLIWVFSVRGAPGPDKDTTLSPSRLIWCTTIPVTLGYKLSKPQSARAEFWEGKNSKAAFLGCVQKEKLQILLCVILGSFFNFRRTSHNPWTRSFLQEDTGKMDFGFDLAFQESQKSHAEKILLVLFSTVSWTTGPAPWSTNGATTPRSKPAPSSWKQFLSNTTETFCLQGERIVKVTQTRQLANYPLKTWADWIRCCTSCSHCQGNKYPLCSEHPKERDNLFYPVTPLWVNLKRSPEALPSLYSTKINFCSFLQILIMFSWRFVFKCILTGARSVKGEGVVLTENYDLWLKKAQITVCVERYKADPILLQFRLAVFGAISSDCCHGDLLWQTVNDGSNFLNSSSPRQEASDTDSESFSAQSTEEAVN